MIYRSGAKEIFTDDWILLCLDGFGVDGVGVGVEWIGVGIGVVFFIDFQTQRLSQQIGVLGKLTMYLSEFETRRS